MKILALGAGGFIGSHLSARLLDDGHEIVGVDLHEEKLGACLDRRGFTFLRGDIRDPAFDFGALIGGSDLVVDLVAHANPGTYVSRPLEVFRLNFTENLRIAEECVKRNRRLLQFSSCEVYGKTVAALLPRGLTDPGDRAHGTFSEEETPFILGPVARHRWIYACAKQLLERVIHAYGLEEQLRYTIIRPFNFLGPRIDYLPSEGEGVPRVFSFFMEALLRGEPMKLVEGGLHRRCYTYIDDAVDCVARIVASPEVCDGQIFNIGSPGNETTIRGLAEQMRELYREHFLPPGERLSPLVDVSAEDFYGEGYDDSDRRIPDITKARTLLGWEPRWGLRELLLETMAYHAPGEGRGGEGS